MEEVEGREFCCRVGFLCLNSLVFGLLWNGMFCYVFMFLLSSS